MKKVFCLSMFVFVYLSISAQYSKAISYISQNRDTLMLPDNSTGHSILTSWKNVPQTERPIIVFASEDLIAVLNNKNKNKTLKKN
jgi:hypothetical protein